MLDQIDNLESLVDKVSAAMSELKAEKDRIGGELENLRSILGVKEKEMDRLTGEREVAEKRLAVLLEKLRASWEPASDPVPSEVDEEPTPLESEEEPREASAGELFRFEDPHQGDLADRF